MGQNVRGAPLGAPRYFALRDAMDLTQLIISYNPAWTRREMAFFVLVFAVAFVVLAFRVRAGRMRAWQMVASLALLTYVAVVYASCVFTRMPTGRHTAEPELFWSWAEVIFHHDKGLLKENLLNMVMLFPAGVLTPLAAGKRLSVARLILCGVVLSGGIEVLEYVLERGLFEWDDIVHNTLGFVMGGLVGRLMLH